MNPEGYIIGTLTLLNLGWGAQEPILQKCCWKGVPAKALAWLRSKTQDIISVRNADNWILADCVAAATGDVHTAFSLLQFQLWQYEEEPWFPRAYFLFCRLRSSDFIQWLVEWVAFHQRHLKPTNEKTRKTYWSGEPFHLLASDAAPICFSSGVLPRLTRRPWDRYQVCNHRGVATEPC